MSLTYRSAAPQTGDKRVVITIESKPDALGRRHFSAEWFEDRPRGQCFFATLDEHISYWQSEGYRVVLKELVELHDSGRQVRSTPCPATGHACADNACIVDEDIGVCMTRLERDGL